MKILLEKLLLDKENPRFIVPHGPDTDEEEIFTYLKENEVLDELITGISRTGFFQIGEKPIVVQIADTDEYIVLEGNRRICALKALHGFYSATYSFDETLKQASAEIEVDVVTSRDEIQPYLAARHIQGIQKWKPEARRNFYYKHYIDNKSLTYIERITQQKLSEIKKFIKEAVFLDFFKRNSGFTAIDKPSLVYERIQRYCVELKLIHEFVITEQLIDCRITINTDILNQAEFEEFCRLLAEGIFGENKFIDSRNINKLNDFRVLLQSTTVEQNSPRLKELFAVISNKLSRATFVPNQLKFEAVKGRVPRVAQIIDYSIISDDAVVVICNDGVEIEENTFLAGEPGRYFITINEEYNFTFVITNFLRPVVRVI